MYTPPALTGDPAAVPILVELLDYPGASVNLRWAATVGLKRVRPPSRAGGPALLRMARDPYKGPRMAAREALQAIDPQAADRAGASSVEARDPVKD